MQTVLRNKMKTLAYLFDNVTASAHLQHHFLLHCDLRTCAI